jgi:drug/metabolite transporter (DMT)-like permease
MEKPGLKDYLLLHLIIIFWGFTSVLGVLSKLEAPYLVVYRTGLSFATLLVFIYFRYKTGRRPDFLSSDGLAIIFAGILTAFHWTTFFASAQLSNVSTCLAGMSTTALWTSLLEPVFTKKRFEWKEIILAIFVSIGLILIFKSDFSMAFGLGISLISALACSGFSIINRQLVKNHKPLIITTWEMGFAFVFSLLFIPFLLSMGLLKQKSFALPQGWDWLNILFLAWVCTVFAYTVSIELMKKFSAFAINLTVNLEPVYGIFLGLLIFGQKEKMEPLFYVGLFMILSGVFLFPFLNKLKIPFGSKS